jgi:hypothetical protein
MPCARPASRGCTSRSTPSIATFGRHRLPATEHWTELYLKVFAQHRATWIALLRGAAEAEGPLLFGCTAGKDRTGIAAAVLLRSLGVETKRSSPTMPAPRTR